MMQGWTQDLLNGYLIVSNVAPPVVLGDQGFNVIKQCHYPSDSSALRHKVVGLPASGNHGEAIKKTSRRTHLCFTIRPASSTCSFSSNAAIFRLCRALSDAAAAAATVGVGVDSEDSDDAASDSEGCELLSA